MIIDYDDIAISYDALVQQDVKQSTFPYSGYQKIQDLILEDIVSRDKKPRILDLGCGTGLLYQLINPSQLHLVGVDGSLKMLEIAKKRYPQGEFYLHDLYKGLPIKVLNQSYDFIIINYVCMHFNFKTCLDLIQQLSKRLKPHGKIIISDLLFMNPECKQTFFANYPEHANLNLYFHIYGHFVNQMKQQMALSFFEINSYTGMIIIENVNDFTLLFEDPLVKYKSNTEKWRSTHPQRNSE